MLLLLASLLPASGFMVHPPAARSCRGPSIGMAASSEGDPLPAPVEGAQSKIVHAVPPVTPLPALRKPQEQEALAKAAAAAEAIAHEKTSTRAIAAKHATVLRAHATLLSSEKYYTTRQRIIAGVERQKAKARAEAAEEALAAAQRMRTLRRGAKKARVLEAEEEVERCVDGPKRGSSLSP